MFLIRGKYPRSCGSKLSIMEVGIGRIQILPNSFDIRCIKLNCGNRLHHLTTRSNIGLWHFSPYIDDIANIFKLSERKL